MTKRKDEAASWKLQKYITESPELGSDHSARVDGLFKLVSFIVCLMRSDHYV